MGSEGLIQLDKVNDIWIKIGTILNVAADSKGEEIDKIVFIGAKPGIIITSPLSEGTPELPLHESTLHVRYLFEEQVFEFTTRFIKNIYTPLPLTFLEFPGHVHRRELRSHRRIDCFISAVIEVRSDRNTKKDTGVIKNISKSGCRFILPLSEDTKEMFQAGEEISLRLHFPGLRGEHEALGKVLEIKKEDYEISIRVQFHDIQSWVPPYE